MKKEEIRRVITRCLGNEWFDNLLQHRTSHEKQPIEDPDCDDGGPINGLAAHQCSNDDQDTEPKTYLHQRQSQQHDPIMNGTVLPDREQLPSRKRRASAQSMSTGDRLSAPGSNKTRKPARRVHRFAARSSADAFSHSARIPIDSNTSRLIAQDPPQIRLYRLIPAKPMTALLAAHTSRFTRLARSETRQR